MTPDRLKLLSQAFREVPLTCGDLKLRPITAGSMMILMDLGNSLFTGDQDEEEVEGKEASPVDALGALFEFIWVHAAPEDEVLQLMDDDYITCRRASRKLGLSIGFDDLASFQEQFAEVGVRIRAAMSEVIPEGEPGKPVPSPIGSPPISGTSMPREIPSGTDMSSGSSPLPSGSSLSTPPREPADSAPDGPVSLPMTPPPTGTSGTTFLN